VVKQNLHRQIRENKVTLIFGDLAQEVPMITVKMIQLLQNLISNAIKFRSKTRNSVIEIDLKDKGCEWLISIKDNGIGIAEQYLQEIFQLFRKLHNQTEYQGSGIGLATCKKIVNSTVAKFGLIQPKEKAQPSFLRCQKTTMLLYNPNFIKKLIFFAKKFGSVKKVLLSLHRFRKKGIASSKT
jgi:light-regulated signal transduction histidine kinase (bacteriophytochrome)